MESKEDVLTAAGKEDNHYGGANVRIAIPFSKLDEEVGYLWVQVLFPMNLTFAKSSLRHRSEKSLVSPVLLPSELMINHAGKAADRQEELGVPGALCSGCRSPRQSGYWAGRRNNGCECR